MPAAGVKNRGRKGQRLDLPGETLVLAAVDIGDDYGLRSQGQDAPGRC